MILGRIYFTYLLARMDRQNDPLYRARYKVASMARRRHGKKCDERQNDPLYRARYKVASMARRRHGKKCD